MCCRARVRAFPCVPCCLSASLHACEAPSVRAQVAQGDESRVAESSAYLEFWLFKLCRRKQEYVKPFGLDINSQARPENPKKNSDRVAGMLALSFAYGRGKKKGCRP